jgi:C-terminal peptidase prc
MLLLLANASAQSPTAAEPYGAALDLVEALYLYPDGVTSRALFLAAGRELEDRIPWLLVDETPGGLALRHGAEAPFAVAPWPTAATLADALGDLSLQVETSGWDCGDVDPGMAALAGMAEALDAHSRVLTDERLDRFNVRLSGTLVGIGATFDHRSERVVVSTVGADGPAARAGLRPGDELVRVDGRSTRGMPLSEVSRRVRGDAGTPVTLRISRDGQELDVVPTRAEVVVPNVTRRVLDGGVGYVAIDHVSQKTVENLTAELAALAAEDALAHGLVIDLRGNTGGSMKESARLADLFVESGELLRTEGRGGAPVENLQARMVARDDGTEPPIPLVLLVDERTASGAEILAGALLELDRAVLVGRRTYGKGTVQKIYDLAPEVRFKLTVARYVLAHGRVLTNGGLVPDVTVGRLYDYGTHLDTFLPDASELGVAAGDVVWQVRSGVDLPLELARRTLLSDPAPDRASTLAALTREAAAVRAEEEQALVATLTKLGVDWTPPPAPPTNPAAVHVDLRAEPADGDRWRLVVQVRDDGDVDLHQVMVELSSASARWWDGLRVPIGRVPAGGTVERALEVEVERNVWPRVDPVVVRVRSAGREVGAETDRALPSSGPEEPTVRLVARLLPATPDVAGPGGGPVRVVEVEVQNLDRTPLTGVEVHLGWPETEGVELVDWGQRTSEVPARSTHVFSLATEVAATLGEVPLEVTLATDDDDDLVKWPVTLSTSGAAVTLQAPRIERPAAATRVPTGPWSHPIDLSDDGALRYATVWVDGRKVSWTPGTGSTLRVTPSATLSPGPHRVSVSAVDAQGLSTRRTFWLVAEAPPTVDAGG